MLVDSELTLRCVVVLSSLPTPSFGWQFCVCVFGGMVGIGDLAEELGLQVNTLQDVLGHAQDRIHWLDLLLSKKGETCHSKQSVERIHL